MLLRSWRLDWLLLRSSGLQKRQRGTSAVGPGPSPGSEVVGWAPALAQELQVAALGQEVPGGSGAAAAGGTSTEGTACGWQQQCVVMPVCAIGP